MCVFIIRHSGSTCSWQVSHFLHNPDTNIDANLSAEQVVFNKTALHENLPHKLNYQAGISVNCFRQWRDKHEGRGKQIFTNSRSNSPLMWNVWGFLPNYAWLITSSARITDVNTQNQVERIGLRGRHELSRLRAAPTGDIYQRWACLVVDSPVRHMFRSGSDLIWLPQTELYGMSG